MRRGILILSCLLWCIHSNVAVADLGLVEAGRATARYAGLIKVYDASLRVTAGTTRAEALQSPATKILELRYRVAIAASDLIKAADTTLRRQHDDATRARYAEETTRLHGYFRDVDKGDRFALRSEGDTLTLLFNDETQVQITRAGFAAYYLGIWLGDSPLSTSVREQLLAKL